MAPPAEAGLPLGWAGAPCTFYGEGAALSSFPQRKGSEGEVTYPRLHTQYVQGRVSVQADLTSALLSLSETREASGRIKNICWKFIALFCLALCLFDSEYLDYSHFTKGKAAHTCGGLDLFKCHLNAAGLSLG